MTVHLSWSENQVLPCEGSMRLVPTDLLSPSHPTVPHAPEARDRLLSVLNMMAHPGPLPQCPPLTVVFLSLLHVVAPPAVLLRIIT